MTEPTAQRQVSVSDLAGQGGQLLVDRVEQELRRRVGQIRNVPRAKLPQERVLAKTYGVSLKTVRKAMQRLKRDRLVRSVQGTGTFVVPAAQENTSVLVVASNVYHPCEMMAVGVVS